MSDPHLHAAFVAPEISKLAPLFPGYDIEILIATGGMGAVYRAVQKSLDRKVAIKILPREFGKDKAYCAGFEAEAKAMARLNHPNLIGVYDFGEVDGMLYIIMEYVPGKSLFHSSNGMAIEPGEVIRLVTGICHGLAHAHENGILHRDIKPSNILLDHNAQPKIGDFGLARPVETKVQDGEEIFGTPHYTAPEVVSTPHSVDCRADIFSVGVLLHELLTGRLPADDRRTASAIVGCDPRFDVIIRRATNPIPDARYHSAEEISRELEVIAASAGPRVLRTAAAPAARNPRAPQVLAPVVGKRVVAAPTSNAPVFTVMIVGILLAAFALIYMANQPDGEVPPPAPGPKPPTPAPAVQPAPDRETQFVPKTPPQPRPRPDPIDPSPEPDETTKPKPAVDPDPPPTPEPDPTTDPDEEKPLPPTFDVEGFFTRARLLMKDRATPIIAEAITSRGNNLADFERSAKRFVRRMDRGNDRDDANEALTELLATAAADQNRIPAELPADLNNVDELDDVHEDSLEKQEAIDGALMASLGQLAATYILGLEKQIERMDAELEEDPIELIRDEIATTRNEATHFPNLMLGIDPKKDEPEED